MLKRKIFIFIILSLIALLLLAGGFYFFGKKKQPQAVVEKIPQAKLVVADPVISPIPSYDGNSLWYFNFQNRLFRNKACCSLTTVEQQTEPLPALRPSPKRNAERAWRSFRT